MPVVPIECSGEREVLIRCAGVGRISDEEVHPFLVQLEPLRIEVGNDGSSVDEIRVVEMVVVVVRTGL